MKNIRLDEIIITFNDSEPYTFKDKQEALDVMLELKEAYNARLCDFEVVLCSSTYPTFNNPSEDLEDVIDGYLFFELFDEIG